MSCWKAVCLWWTRLLDGDERDHRLVRITPPPSFVSEPVRLRPFSPSCYEAMAAQRDAMMGQQRGLGAGMGALMGSNIGAALGLGVVPRRQY
jgi:hypothetical protein